VLTDTGPVEISVPRDRDSSFEPKIVAKRQRRLTGVDEMVISLSAKGLTHGEIAAHLAEVYGAEVSKQTITTITDRVMEGMAEWQSRPLDSVYAVVFIDAINVKIREGQVANRPIYVALGVTVDGERDVLGLWAGEHGDGEGCQVLAAGPDRDQEPRRPGRVHAGLRRAERPAGRGQYRVG
jgi:putative transposase